MLKSTAHPPATSRSFVTPRQADTTQDHPSFDATLAHARKSPRAKKDPDRPTPRHDNKPAEPAAEKPPAETPAPAAEKKADHPTDDPTKTPDTTSPNDAPEQADSAASAAPVIVLPNASQPTTESPAETSDPNSACSAPVSLTPDSHHLNAPNLTTTQKTAAVVNKNELQDTDAATSDSDESLSTDPAATKTLPKQAQLHASRYSLNRDYQEGAKNNDSSTLPEPLDNDFVPLPLNSPATEETAELITSLKPTDAASPVAATSSPSSILHHTPSPLPLDSHLRADSTSAPQEMPKNTQENVLEQVVLGLRGKFDPQNGRAQIRLDPPALGTVHVSINLQNGQLSAQLQSDSRPVQELLRSNLDQLKNVLESQGVTVDKIVVDNTQEKNALTMPNSSVQTNPDGRGANHQRQDQRRSSNTQPDDDFSRLWNELHKAPQPVDLVA